MLTCCGVFRSVNQVIMLYTKLTASERCTSVIKLEKTSSEKCDTLGGFIHNQTFLDTKEQWEAVIEKKWERGPNPG